MPFRMNPADVVCVVTGAAKGIGLAISSALVAAGARVVMTDVNEVALNSATKSLGRDRVRTVRADVASADNLAAVVRAAEQAFGPPSVWINNAGLARHRAI